MQLKENKIRLLCLFAALFLFNGCVKDLTNINTIYENNFEAGNPKGITTAGWLSETNFGLFPFKKIINFQNQKLLGTFNNSRLNLTFDSLPSHTIIRVEFDLYIHDQWQNNLWIMKMDGLYRLITGFSNDSTIQQAYPNWFNNGPTSPAGNQAQEIYLPGVCSKKNSIRGTSVYRMVHSLPHTKKTFELELSDAGGAKNDTCTRSWSIDNIKIVTLEN